MKASLCIGAIFVWMTAEPPAKLCAAALLESGWLKPYVAPLFAGDFQLREVDVPGDAFYYSASDSAHAFFVRVYQQAGGPLEQSILRRLHEEGASVCPILHTTSAQYALDTPPFRIDIKPLISGGRSFNRSDADFSKIVSGLRKVHEVLAVVPEASLVKEAALSRAQRHTSTQTRLTSLVRHNEWDQFPHVEAWARQHAAWLVEVCEDFDPGIHCLPGAQVLHGDIHPGNMLFLNDEVVFIDFEHSLYTFAPRLWDLAYLFQRCAVHDHLSAEALRRRRAEAEHIYQLDLTPLPDFMRHASRLCVAILFTDLFENNAEIPIAELDKFFRLEQEALLLKSSW
ncbi:N/A [soil metagenome]